MHLIYLDESGNSGGNLNDPNQPVFALCALVVSESRWQKLEAALSAEIGKHWAGPVPESFEIHAAELMNPRTDYVRHATPDQRLALMTSWLSAAKSHDVRLVYRTIVKKRYASWLSSTFGSGVMINPHVAALALVSQVVNSYLVSLPGKPLGIFISDENQQVARDVDKSIRLLRSAEGPLRLTQIIEKGFFIESHKSLVLQLCDLCAYIVRRKEEGMTGGKAKPVDEVLWKQLSPMTVVGDERMPDVIQWLEGGQKKERPGA